MTRHSYAANTAIVGIGATEFSKNSGRSELQLAIEACTAACEDAGLPTSRVDGLVTYTMETNPENEIMRGLGIEELRHFSRVHFGGGAPCGTVELAAMAVNEGVADYVSGVTRGDPTDFSRLKSEDFAAIEYYSSGATAPSRYNQTGSDCGVLMLWRRYRMP